MTERTLARKGTWEVESWVRRETYGYKSALDFGSGLGAYTRVILCEVKHGIEAFEPYVVKARSDPQNAGCQFFLGDMRDYELFVDRPQYDVAMFIDTLEHLPKQDATDLIVKCQAQFKKILLFIPLGPHDQEPCDDNELQRHLSFWGYDDIEELGFSGKKFLNPQEKRVAGELHIAFLTWKKK
jgi:hypothetical protein